VVLSVNLLFEEGNRDKLEEHDDLVKAADYVRRLADEIGQRPAGDGHGLVAKVASIKATG